MASRSDRSRSASWAQTALSSSVLIGGSFALLAPKFEAAWSAGKKFFSALDVTKLVNTKTAVESIGTVAPEAEKTSLAMTGLGLAVGALAVTSLAQWAADQNQSLTLTHAGTTRLRADLDHLAATGEIAPSFREFIKMTAALRGGDGQGLHLSLADLQNELVRFPGARFVESDLYDAAIHAVRVSLGEIEE